MYFCQLALLYRKPKMEKLLCKVTVVNSSKLELATTKQSTPLGPASAYFKAFMLLYHFSTSALNFRDRLSHLHENRPVPSDWCMANCHAVKLSIVDKYRINQPIIHTYTINFSRVYSILIPFFHLLFHISKLKKGRNMLSETHHFFKLLNC